MQPVRSVFAIYRVNAELQTKSFRGRFGVGSILPGCGFSASREICNPFRYRIDGVGVYDVAGNWRHLEISQTVDPRE